MSIEWFRWYHSTVSDPKFSACARKAKQPKSAVIATWAAILEYASQHEDRGSLEGLDVDTLSSCLDLDEEVIDAILAALTAKGLIADGRIAKWGKRQVNREREDDSKERVRRYRERLKAVTPGNATVTPGNALEEIRVEESSSNKAAVGTPPRAHARATAAAATLEELIAALPVPFTDILAAYHRLSPYTIPCAAPTLKLIQNIAERCRPDLDQLPALENWEAYFEYVNESPLLTGKAPPRDGYPTSFVADLEWLTDANNYRKVAEEHRFHRGLPRNNHHRQEYRHGIH